jgi:formylglycine-generating enzyme required for sulfatase activity
MGTGIDVPRRTVVLEHAFAISNKEVTMKQFDEFTAEHPIESFPKVFAGQLRPEPAAVRTSVSWHSAAFYCNWLSQREELPPQQWCYLPNEQGNYSTGMRLAPNWVNRVGYRLPMEAEWLVACGANEDDGYFFGKSVFLISEYGWSSNNAKNRPHVAGWLKPNRYGLFDLHGNVFEPCQDRFQQEPGYDVRNEEVITEIGRCLRGGSYQDRPELYHTLSFRNYAQPWVSGPTGVRLVRSIPRS